MTSIRHDDKAGFFTDQKFLDHYPMAGRSEAVAREHVLDGLNGLGFGLRNHDAFSGSQTIGFNDNGRALSLNVGLGGFDFSKRLIGRGRDAMPRHEIFTEGLGSLELSGALGRTEAGQVLPSEGIDDAKYERRFRSYDRKAHGVPLGEFDQPGDIVCSNGNVGNALFPGRSRIAGRDKDLIGEGRLGGLPGQGMFAATAANDQDIHAELGFESGGLGE